MTGSQPSRDEVWRAIVAELPERDDATEWFTLAELAPLLGIKRRSLSGHCRDLWPNWEGQYRLNREQATRLIRRVCYAGRKVPGLFSRHEHTHTDVARPTTAIMLSVRVDLQLTADDLFDAAQQLSPEELNAFIVKLGALTRKRRNQPAAPQSEVSIKERQISNSHKLHSVS